MAEKNAAKNTNQKQSTKVVDTKEFICGAKREWALLLHELTSGKRSQALAKASETIPSKT